ncbi:hypothetical protein [Streptomyces sp. BK239]|uniref:hypothetical protein n=1 Tax=Streptomyces sp. BK239 TaxID=2512155 RepID=UPI0010E65D14|nr:hypothetical protein [Streptomyces sp. BK239]RZU15116.1 hypothetical protein EV567_4100 [Streptomyces sp. BK239]
MRPALAAAVGLAAVAALCAALLTASPQDRRAPDGASRDAGGQGQTYAEGIACARLIAEGDVLDVHPASRPGRVLLRFAVSDWIKPGRGAGTVELDLVDPSVAQVEEPFAKGQHLLLVVPSARTWRRTRPAARSCPGRARSSTPTGRRRPRRSAHTTGERHRAETAAVLRCSRP